MKKEEIEQKYNTMLTFPSIVGEVAANKVNVYRCAVGHQVKTIDRAKGVTPMFIICPSCNDSRTPQMASSNFYRDSAPQIEPTHEWYRPTLEECYKMDQDKTKWGLLEHILKGGLELRQIEKEATDGK